MSESLSSSVNPVHVNQLFTITALFKSELAVDGKVVSFYVGSVLLGTSTTKDGIATFTTSWDRLSSSAKSMV